jgi:hypothetical protein
MIFKTLENWILIEVIYDSCLYIFLSNIQILKTSIMRKEIVSYFEA